MTLSLHLAREIRAFGKSAGRQFSAAEIQAIEATAASVATLDDAGQIRFDLGAGPIGTLDAALKMMSVGMGAPITSKTSTPASSIPANSSATARAIELNQAARAESADIKRCQAEDLVTTFGSPWRTGNATHRAFVTNCNPELATRLRAEAGAHQ